MRFGNYLESKKIKRRDAALALDISEAQVSRLVSGASLPSLGLAQQILTWSAGAVGLQDWEVSR